MTTHFFEIKNQEKTTKFTSEDLPLRIGGDQDSHIIVNSLRGDTCLIGESKGHLFLQPITDSETAIDIFHNNKKIKSSVWIKSGDTTLVDDQQISYEISGDIAKISVTASTESTLDSPSPPPSTPPSHTTLPRVTGGGETDKKISRKAKIIASIFTVLVIATISLLLTKSFTIKVTPIPDKISVSGFPPVFNVGEEGHFLAIKGKYTVLAQKNGYSQLKEVIKVGGKRNHFILNLSPLPGRIDFSTNPESNATFTVDQNAIGTSPLHDIELSIGEHIVRVTKDRYQSISQQITVDGYDKSQSFSFTLLPAWGEVTLTSSPSGAIVEIDNKQTDQKTPVTVELLEGKHTIVLAMAKYQPAQIELAVTAGTTLEPPTIKLIPALANLAITSEPTGSNVTIDSTFIGKTPLQQKVLSQKTHIITVSAEGHKNSEQKISLAAAQTKSINFLLTPQYGSVFISKEPAELKLLIDGQLQRDDKNRFQLLAMPHTFEARAKGYKTEIKKITPLINGSQYVDFRLSPLKSTGTNKAAAPGRNLLLMAPARFTMGTSRREQGRRSNEIKRDITISRYFYLAAKEVTNKEYRQFKKDHSSGDDSGHSLNGDKQPVVNVSWEDAVAYLNWLSLQDGLSPFYQETNGKITPIKPITNGYRLPFEAEWAYAARFAGRKKTAKYPWSGSFPPPDNAGNFADESARGFLPVVIKGYNDSFVMSAPVASFKANAAGFFDMGGNVSEWCHDFYVPTPRPAAQPERDPIGPQNGTHHVVRGASWRDSAVTELRLSYRGYSRKAQDDLGFRIARYTK